VFSAIVIAELLCVLVLLVKIGFRAERMQHGAARAVSLRRQYGTVQKHCPARQTPYGNGGEHAKLQHCIVCNGIDPDQRALACVCQYGHIDH
jgi:hypothetical protein